MHPHIQATIDSARSIAMPCTKLPMPENWSCSFTLGNYKEPGCQWFTMRAHDVWKCRDKLKAFFIGEPTNKDIVDLCIEEEREMYKVGNFIYIMPKR